MASRYSLSDKQWAQIAELVPGKKTDSGRTAVNNQLFVDAVIYVAKTGIPWRDLPVGYGNGTVFGGGLIDGLNETFGVILLRRLTSQISWNFNWIPLRSRCIKWRAVGGGRREAYEKKRMQIVVGALVAAGVG